LRILLQFDNFQEFSGRLRKHDLEILNDVEENTIWSFFGLAGASESMILRNTNALTPAIFKQSFDPN